MEARDETWFSLYNDIRIPEHGSFLRPQNVESERDAFLQGERSAPQFVYVCDLINESPIDERLIELRTRILNEENDVFIRDAYVRAIEYRLTTLALIRASCSGDENTFSRMSEELFGRPTVEECAQALALVYQCGKKVSYSWGPHLTSLFTEFHSESVVPHTEVDLTPPTGEILSDIDIKEAFELAVRRRGLSLDITLDPNALMIGVDHGAGKIRIPKGRTEYVSVVHGLIAHEIEVHIMRRENGLRSPLLLLSRGLSGYLLFEEGLGAYRQHEHDASSLPGVSLYIGVTLARGIGVSSPWDFAHIFELMVELLTFMSSVTGVPEDTRIHEEAWLRAVRVFRGTVGNAPRVCCTRDSMYWRGFTRVARMVREKHPELTRVMCGKYDPENEAHVALLNHLGIS